MQSVPRWEHFYHQADIGVRGFGASPAEAFAQAALALTAVLTHPDEVRLQESAELRCDAPDLELLLTDFLNAVIFEMSTSKRLFGRFEVSIKGEQLVATAWGEPVEVARHEAAVEVKGATYTELKVAQQADGSWLAQCVVDV